MQLYSRDDTILALDLQKQICLALEASPAYSQGGPAPYPGASIPCAYISAQPSLQGFVLRRKGLSICLVERSRH